MKRSDFSQLVKILLQKVTEDVVNAAYAESIIRISAEFEILSSGCFEFWLAESRERVDLNIGFIRALEEYHAITDHIKTKTINRNFEPLVNAVKNWSHPEFPFSLFVQQLWLVFDIPDPNKEEVIPWYYFLFVRSNLFHHASLQKEIVVRSLPLLDERFAPELTLAWKSFFEDASATAEIEAIGVQSNRNISQLRVSLVFSSYNDIYSFLERRKWPGNTDELHRYVGHIASDCTSYGLSIDVSPAVQPRIGIDFFYKSKASRQEYERLTDKLIGIGLCSQQKQKAFLEWDGEFDIPNIPDMWRSPNSYHPTDQIPKSVTVKRGPKHIKMVYEPGNVMTAKGYLGFFIPRL